MAQYGMYMKCMRYLPPGIKYILMLHNMGRSRQNITYIKNIITIYLQKYQIFSAQYGPSKAAGRVQVGARPSKLDRSIGLCHCHS